MEKTRLTFKINNKSVVYNGFPDNRPKDLMEVLAKLNVDPSKVVPTFRENIVDNKKYTDDEINSLFQVAKAARERKNAKSASESVQQPSPAPAAAHVDPTISDEQKERLTLTFQGKQFSFMGYPSAKEGALIQLLVKQRDVLTYDIALETYRTNLPRSKLSDDEIWQSVSDAIEAKTGSPPAMHSQSQTEVLQDDQELLDAINKYNAIPKEEHDEIRGFIRHVLEDDDNLMSSTLGRGDAEEAQEGALLTYRAGNTGGKVTLYCQLSGDKTNTTKIIYAPLTVTFEELKGMVAKKFGSAMDLSFEEGDDIVEIDDDDVLNMFLELQQSVKKLRLICAPARARVVNTDTITNTEAPATSKGTENFSNGELDVSLEKTFAGHTHAVYACAFSSTGDRFVSTSRDRSVRVWSVAGKAEPALMKGGHNGFALSCDFSPLGSRVVSSSEDRMVKVWNTRSCSKTASLKGHSDKVYCVQYSPTGEFIVSGSCDNTVRVWSAETFAKEATLKGHTLAVFSCAFSNKDDGKRVVSGSDDRLIKIWRWEEGKEEKTLRGHSGTIWSVSFSHDDKYIVSASMDSELRLWLVDSGNCVHNIAAHKAPIHHAIFSPNDKYIFTCARDCSVKVWRTETAEHVETIAAHSSTVYHMALRGESLLTSSLDTTIKLWKVKNLLK